MQRERHTVDQLFSNKIDKFNKNDKLRIEKYYGKIEEYKQKLNELSETEDEKKTLFLGKIQHYEEKIKILELKINNYFLENYNDLFHYFEIKKDIEKNNNPKTIIHRFFDKTRNIF